MKDNIPASVFEDIATFADATSLVAFACCNRRIWECISVLQRIWRQRYHEEFLINGDDDEAKWLDSYVKTLRTPKLLVANITTRIDGKYDIDWFQAFRYRHMAGLNWFDDNGSRRLKHETTILSTSSDCVNITVLERTFLRYKSLVNSRVIEHFQVKDAANNVQRYWQTYKLCYTGPDLTITGGHYAFKDNYLVVAVTPHKSTSDTRNSFSGLLVWPANRIRDEEPTRYPCADCTYHDMRGDWLLFSTVESYGVDTDAPWNITHVHVVNLATKQGKTHSTSKPLFTAFLQRVTDEEAVVFLASEKTYEDFSVIKWQLWEVSKSIDEPPWRFLLKDRFKVAEDSSDLTVKRLNNNSVIIVHDRIRIVKSNNNARRNDDSDADAADDDDSNDKFTLGVIATNLTQTQLFMRNFLLWSHYVDVLIAKTSTARNRITVLSDQGFSFYNLTNGDLLSFVPISDVNSLIEGHCHYTANDYLYDPAFYINHGEYVLCPSSDIDKYHAINIMQPSKKKIRTFSCLFSRYNITTDNILMIDHDRHESYPMLSTYKPDSRVKAMINICSANFLHIVFKDGYKILDLSNEP
ncbi:hypothetical protein BDF22DRAFT_697009 [Syncephalis plumigaleata]|nr:hypothetical protein BDF22DRAFT_697009 [Syncephalis plumigaleata]